VVGEYEGRKFIAEQKPETIELAKHATSLESDCPTKLNRSVNQPGSHQKALHANLCSAARTRMKLPSFNQMAEVA
jgi:hypothetical protein